MGEISLGDVIEGLGKGVGIGIGIGIGLGKSTPSSGNASTCDGLTVLMLGSLPGGFLNGTMLLAPGGGVIDGKPGIIDGIGNADGI